VNWKSKGDAKVLMTRSSFSWLAINKMNFVINSYTDFGNRQRHEQKVSLSEQKADLRSTTHNLPTVTLYLLLRMNLEGSPLRMLRTWEQQKNLEGNSPSQVYLGV
jgi:hypothetical protein